MEIRKCDPAKSICLDIAIFFFFFEYCKNCRQNFLNSCVFTKINIFKIIENPLLVKLNIGEISIVAKY